MMVTLPNYEIRRVLGSGAFGYVFEAYDVNNKRKVALKRIEKVGKQLSREYEILTEIKTCDHVIKILDFFYSRNDQGKLIQNIVFEFMTDDFENMIQDKAKMGEFFSEADIKLYMFQVLKGLEFIHSKGIVHRDLKPENILISPSGIVKICDFGSSKHIDPNGKNTPYIVSRYYRAPELNLCITQYNSAIDVWATGCILCEMITKDPIFQGTDEGNQLFAIFKVIGSPSKEDFEDYSKRVPYDPKIFKDFPRYKKDSKRFAERFHIIKDKDNLLDLLYKMFAYVPENRITAAEALSHPFFDDIRKDYYNLISRK